MNHLPTNVTYQRKSNGQIEPLTSVRLNKKKTSELLPFVKDENERYRKTVTEANIVEQNKDINLRNNMKTEAKTKSLVTCKTNEENDKKIEINTLLENSQADSDKLQLDPFLKSNRSKTIKRQMTPTLEVVFPPEDDQECPNDNVVDTLQQRSKSLDELSTCDVDDDTTSHQGVNKPLLQLFQYLKEYHHQVADKSKTCDGENVLNQDNNNNLDEDKVDESTGWYSTLRNQFEKHEQPSSTNKPCRIAGATLKTEETDNNEDADKINKEPEQQKRHQVLERYFFYHPIKSNSVLIDEELPDPDRVQNIRIMFQQHLNLKLKRPKDCGNENCKSCSNNCLATTCLNIDQAVDRPANENWRGSLQDLNNRKYTTDLTYERSQSALSNREEEAIKPFIEDLNCNANVNKKDISKVIQKLKTHVNCIKKEGVMRKTEDKTIMVESQGKIMKGVTDQRKLRRSPKILIPSKNVDVKPRPKWTDTGSMSSGVSSDFSSYDTDYDTCSRDGQVDQELYTSSEEEMEEHKYEKHYISNEVLEKIRAFGTSVTYFGGKMIKCSLGPNLSPTTKAIIEETSHADESLISRKFQEFNQHCIKTRTMEPKGNKRIGRTSSFGQKDVIYRSNLLDKKDIETFRKDLETELGIRCPKGVEQSQSIAKLRLIKSNSVGSRIEVAEPPSQQTVSRIVEEKNVVEDESKIKSSASYNKEETETINHVESNTDDGVKDVKSITEDEEFCNKQTSDDGKSNSEFRVLFGYERHPLIQKPFTDMEFEEFEVCEFPYEKYERDETETVDGCIHDNDPDECKERKGGAEERDDDKTVKSTKEVANVNIITDETVFVKPDSETFSQDECIINKPSELVESRPIYKSNSVSIVNVIDNNCQAISVLGGNNEDIAKDSSNISEDVSKVTVNNDHEANYEDNQPGDYKIKIEIKTDGNHQPPNVEWNTFEEMIFSEEEPMDSLEIYLQDGKRKNKAAELEKLRKINQTEEQTSCNNEAKREEKNQQVVESEIKKIDDKSESSKKGIVQRRKWNINLNNETVCSTIVEDNKVNTSIVKTAEETSRHRVDNKRLYEKNSNWKGNLKSRWPVETTVIVDMQKSDETTPKVLLKHSNSIVKTKKRVY